MRQITCSDCGTVYAANEHSCPTCGCPNDHYQPQQTEPQPASPSQSANGTGDDFNETRQYSPLASKPWFFKAPWPLKKYAERGKFDKAHPFLGWLFGPWYLTCKSEGEREEYAVINNIFYFFNLIFKTWLYSVLWAFFKGLPIVLLWLVVVLMYGGLVGFAVRGSYYSSGSLAAVSAGGVVLLVLYVVFALIFTVIGCCGLGQALHRYWPSIHRTWRRVNKRYWSAMKNKD